MNDKKRSNIIKLLQKIPKGKVTTYKILAQYAGIKNPRTIGQIIHQNDNPLMYPCHRVIRSDGSIADGYAFGGQKAQIEKLADEGIKIYNAKIELKKYLFLF